MQDLLDRYARLSDYVKDLSIVGVKKAREKLPAENATEKQLSDFEKKLEKAEKKQTEVNGVIEELKRKRNIVRDIMAHKYFDEKTMSPGFMKTFNGCKNKLDKFKFDEEDQLIEGKPINTEIKPINTDHLEKLWAEVVATKEPKTMMVNKQRFETYVIKAKTNFDQFRPIFQKTPGATDKLEAWTKMEHALMEQFQNGKDMVDAGPMEVIRNELGTLIPKPKTEKRCPGSCRGKGKVVNGPYCQDCSTDYWELVYADMVKRNELYKKQVGPIEYANYEHGLLHHFHDAHANFEDKFGKRGWDALEKIYKQIDKILPPLEEESSSSDRPPGVAKYEITDKLPDDYDDDDEEEEEDDEEEEYSDDSSAVISRKRSKRSSDSLGKVLATFSGISPHLLELRKIYEKDGDSSEFEGALKKIKNSFVERYKIKVFHKETGTLLPFLPGESIFFSREEANANGEKYVKMIENQGNYRYEVEVLAPGE